VAKIKAEVMQIVPFIMLAMMISSI
jgi:hypothetical protein